MRALEMWIMSKVALLIFFATLFAIFISFYQTQERKAITEDLSVLASKITEKTRAVASANVEYMRDTVLLPPVVEVADVRAPYKIVFEVKEKEEKKLLVVYIETTRGPRAYGVSSVLLDDVDVKGLEDVDGRLISELDVKLQEFYSGYRYLIIIEKEGNKIRVGWKKVQKI